MDFPTSSIAHQSHLHHHPEGNGYAQGKHNH